MLINAAKNRIGKNIRMFSQNVVVIEAEELTNSGELLYERIDQAYSETGNSIYYNLLGIGLLLVRGIPHY